MIFGLDDSVGGATFTRHVARGTLQLISWFLKIETVNRRRNTHRSTSSPLSFSILELCSHEVFVGFDGSVFNGAKSVYLLERWSMVGVKGELVEKFAWVRCLTTGRFRNGIARVVGHVRSPRTYLI